MPQLRAIYGAVVASWLAISVSGPPSPAIAASSAFTAKFRIARYLQLAAELQAVPLEARVRRLKGIAQTPIQAEQIFPLARMLFEEKAGGEFRRPMIGGAVFVDGTSYRDWPLEPIVLFENTPILIVKGYAIGGKPETAMAYLDYCLKNCRWRRDKFVPASSSELRAVVNRFLAKRADLTADAEWLRQQADEA